MPHLAIRFVETDDLADLREAYRQEAATQIVHDQISSRSGWTRNALIECEGRAVGFATIAIGGPWRDANALLEFFLLPNDRPLMEHAFQALRAADPFPAYECQTIQQSFTALVWRHAATIECEKIVVVDVRTSSFHRPDLVLVPQTDADDVRQAMAIRSGGSTWDLMKGDDAIGSGGILFHYNRPYADLHYEIAEAHRGQGHGRYFVQELKRLTRELGHIPAARCSPTNIASLAILLHAGFEPRSQILVGRWK